MKILFVCLGNICRSAAAEAVMKKLVQAQDMTSNFEIDSAGLINYHEGEPADPLMRAHAARRGYIVDSISRPIRTNDFFDFDLILGMDAANIEDLREMAPSLDVLPKIRLVTDYSSLPDVNEVPDPYYGGSEGFERTIRLLEDACEGIVRELKGE